MSDESNQQNGASKPRSLELNDLRSWAMCYIAQDGGLVGHVADVTGNNPHMPDVVLLDPAYVFVGGHRVIVGSATPGGPPQAMFMAGAFSVGPFEFLTSALRIPVRPTIFLPLAALNDVDFQDVGMKVLSGVQQAEQARLQVRAAKSGLDLGGARPLPPPPGGRRLG